VKSNSPRRAIPTTIGAATAIVATAVLAACSGEAPSAGSATESQPTATSPAPQPSPKPKVAPDATSVAQQIQKASGGHIKSLWTYTEDTDPNNLIGRPGGYTSATFAYDNRVADCSAKPDDMCGAQVEQFASDADAVRRRDYIEGIYKAAPILGTEYLTVEGRTLLRVTGKLKPSINRAYVASFKAAMTK
jgi:hypothetical protein